MDVSPFLFHGEDPLASETTDLRHEKPVDQRFCQVVLREPVTSGVLTKDGVENIAKHKYKPGKRTRLEINILAPAWNYLTNAFIPLWITPNMVTALGGMFEVLSYAVGWLCSEDVGNVPSWICTFNGACLILYYTLDSVDGIQARRTGTSSPLGQLFDHGVDSLCNIVHVSTCAACFLLGGSYWFILSQSTLQFSFFVGQWEEYCTGVMGYAQGDLIGVTEVAYGMGFFSLINGFIDREALWQSPVSVWIPSFLAGLIPDYLTALEIRHFLLVLWTLIVASHVVVASSRVVAHLKDQQIAGQYASSFMLLICPSLLSTLPFLLPRDVVETSSRYISLSLGLAYSVITIKMIVFGMAKMAFAIVQWDVLPFLAICLWAHLDERLTAEGARALLQLSCLWYAYRLWSWASICIRQLCDRLDIHCFTAKEKKN